MVQPHFNYCCVVWDSCGKTLSTKLQKLQNRAARVLTFSSYDADAVRLIEELGWKKLEDQRKIHLAVMVYKSINGLAPNYMRSLFTDRISSYSLRDSESRLSVPRPRTNFLKNSFSYEGAMLWNSLPIELRLAESLNKFKADCRSLF